jgi:hypothetical protein
LTANDVLSLGGANATTMSAFTFSSTTGGTASASSTGKVQLVVNATNSDTVTLSKLMVDGVTLDGASGNTGLAGQWNDMGTTTVNGTTYKVYNHSTTEAQVLISNATVNTPATTQAVAIVRAEVSNNTYVDEFNTGTAPLKTDPLTGNFVGSFVDTIQSDAWTIKQTNSTDTAALTGLFVGKTHFSGYVGIDSDNHLMINPQNGQTTPGATLTFTSRFGPFNSVSLKHADLQGELSNGALVTFFDAAGNVVGQTTLKVANSASVSTFSHTLDAGVQATSFKVSLRTQDFWTLDELSATTSGTQSYASGASMTNSTPTLKGTYASALAAGEVINIYEGATYIGTATVDQTTKTWSYNIAAGTGFGSHTYVAKVVNAAGTVISASGNFVINQLASPLALDLNGDGVQTTTLAEGVQFDLLADGSARQVSWLDEHDGFLARDLNQNGVVDSGAELMGTSTVLKNGQLAKDGWQALADLDSNADGIISIHDEAYLDLKVWVDGNSDGVTQLGEMRSLQDQGIESISLAHDHSESTQNGNVLQGLSSFTTTDGQNHEIVDAWLQVATGQSTYDITGERQADGSTTAGSLRLDASDVLASPVQNVDGQHVVHVTGDANDTVNLTSLLDLGPGQGLWEATGTVMDQGMAYNRYTYTGNHDIAVLIDTNIHNVQMG